MKPEWYNLKVKSKLHRKRADAQTRAFGERGPYFVGNKTIPSNQCYLFMYERLYTNINRAGRLKSLVFTSVARFPVKPNLASHSMCVLVNQRSILNIRHDVPTSPMHRSIRIKLFFERRRINASHTARNSMFFYFTTKGWVTCVSKSLLRAMTIVAEKRVHVHVCAHM